VIVPALQGHGRQRHHGCRQHSDALATISSGDAIDMIDGGDAIRVIGGSGTIATTSLVNLST
jgi:hypothetical protein